MKKFVYLFLFIGLFIFLYSPISSAFSYYPSISDVNAIASYYNVSLYNNSTRISNFLAENWDVVYITVGGRSPYLMIRAWDNGAVLSNSNSNYVSLKASNSRYGYINIDGNSKNAVINNNNNNTLAFYFNTALSPMNYWFISGNYKYNDTYLREDPFETHEVLGPFITIPKWDFLSLPSSEVIKIPGLEQDFYTISKSSWNTNLGVLYDSVYTDGIFSDFFAYDYENNVWSNISDYNIEYIRKDDGGISDTYTNTWVENNIQYSTINISSNRIINNTLFRFMFVPIEIDGLSVLDDQIDVWFYVIDENTFLSGDNLDISNTFNDSYKDEYNDLVGKLIDENKDNTNINNIIGGINNIINQIGGSEPYPDNTLNGLISGDNKSGELIKDFLGWAPFDNPFTTILYGVLNGVCDVLMLDENVSLTINIRDQYIKTLNSRDFSMPNGGLKTLVSVFTVVLTIYGMALWFHGIIHDFEVARIDKIKAKLGNDEFYDTDFF